MAYHDTPPTAAEASQRRADLDCLVRALQKELDSDDAAALPALIEQVSAETPFTKQAAERLRVMLSKVSKPAYDLAVKIIGDVGATTVKRILGLE
jgi:thioester reductase-like protein